MKYCMYCGQSLVDKAAFCVKCGRPVVLNPGDDQPAEVSSNPIPNPQQPPQSNPVPSPVSTPQANPTPSPVMTPQPAQAPAPNQEVNQPNNVPQSPYSWAAKSGATQGQTSNGASNNVPQSPYSWAAKSGATQGQTNNGTSNNGAPGRNLNPEREYKRHMYNQLVNQIAWRFRISGIIWMSIAAIQLLIGALIVWVSCVIELEFSVATVLTLAVGIVNLSSGIGDITYASDVRKNPRGVIDKVRPLGGTIVSLIYNAIFGGVIGIGGSIYYLVGVRNFVLENQRAIENEY